jgi:hypothetical protein
LRSARSVGRKSSPAKSKAKSESWFWFGWRLHERRCRDVESRGRRRNITILDDLRVLVIKFTASAAGSAAESGGRGAIVRLVVRANSHLSTGLCGNADSLRVLIVWRLDHTVRVWTVGRVDSGHLTETTMGSRLA